MNRKTTRSGMAILLAASLFCRFAFAQEADRGGVILQFPNNPVSDVLGVYEKLTGKSVIRDSGIFNGTSISLVTPGEVPRDEAIRLIEATLLLNHYVLSHDEKAKTVRIMPEDSNQAKITEGLPVHNAPESLPQGETLVCYYMPLSHLDPVEAGSIFNNHVGLNPYGRITPVLSPPGLLITENTSIVRQLIRLKNVVDLPHQHKGPITEFVKLEYAEASIVSQIIQATLNIRGNKPRVGEDTYSSGGRRDSRRMDNDEEARPQIVADDRLNRIMVVALPDDYAYIMRLIREWDQPTKAVEAVERPLKYLYVDEVLPVLVEFLQESSIGTTPLPGGGSVTTRQLPKASTQAGSLTGRVRRGVEVRDTTGTGAPPAGTNAPGGIQTGPDRITNPIENTAPISVSVGKTRIVADLQANKIIAMGPKESLAKVLTLLDKLDRKPPQVYLATVIGQLTLGDEFKFGIEYLQRFKKTSSSQGGAGSLLSTEGLRAAIGDVRDNLLTKGVPAISPGLNLYGQLGESLDVFVNALEATDKFKVLSRPSIYAANNKKAVITSGQRIPVPTSSLSGFASNSNNLSVRTNIEFQDVVLKLEVVPLINSNREVTLTIAQVNDTVVGEQQVAENVVPIIGTEQLTTTVNIPNRATVVLGGLITETEDKSDSGLPFVRRIPVLGNAFKSTGSKKSRKELIVFIQPIVVEDQAELTEASYQEDIRTNVGAEAAAAFPESDKLVPTSATLPEQKPKAPGVASPRRVRPIYRGHDR